MIKKYAMAIAAAFIAVAFQTVSAQPKSGIIAGAKASGANSIAIPGDWTKTLGRWRLFLVPRWICFPRTAVL